MSSRGAFGLLAMAAFCLPSEAGLLDHFKKKEACDTTCSTTDCRPAIERPCYEIVRTYQRGFARPPLRCDSCAPSAPCDHVPQQVTWPAPPEGCDLIQVGECTGSCDPGLADLIVRSQTDCYACDRREAVLKMGRKFCCSSHPQLMPALVYALNDTDERVRRAAADKIGDQLRANPGCCAPYIICALKLSLSDCDTQVRIQAEQALVACGYRVVSKGAGQAACATDTGNCLPNLTPAAGQPVTEAPEAESPEAGSFVPPMVSPAPVNRPEPVPPASLDQTQVPTGFPKVSKTPIPASQPPALQQRVDLQELVKPRPIDMTSDPSQHFVLPKQGNAPRAGLSTAR